MAEPPKAPQRVDVEEEEAEGGGGGGGGRAKADEDLDDDDGGGRSEDSDGEGHTRCGRRRIRRHHHRRRNSGSFVEERPRSFDCCCHHCCCCLDEGCSGEDFVVSTLVVAHVLCSALLVVHDPSWLPVVLLTTMAAIAVLGGYYLPRPRDDSDGDGSRVVVFASAFLFMLVMIQLALLTGSNAPLGALAAVWGTLLAGPTLVELAHCVGSLLGAAARSIRRCFVAGGDDEIQDDVDDDDEAHSYAHYDDRGPEA